MRKRWDPDPNRQRLYDWAAGLDAWRNRKPAVGAERPLPPRRRRRRRLLALSLAARIQVELAVKGGRIVASCAVQDIGTGTRSVIASSTQMLDVCKLVERVAPSNISVLLLGESGTGKELLARALHVFISRSAKKFVAINCAAIPDTLSESELFGYERGAFTGANRQTAGMIEHAHGGTLFLDEIRGYADPAKLLRFLQERTIVRSGGREPIEVDTRVVSATNRNLAEAISQGQFREDLYYRLGEVWVEIPPLREREGDAALIARSILDRLTK